MKTINNKKKGTAMLITAAILTLVMLFAGCKHKTESKKSEPKYTVTFGVDGGNGTLKAMVGGNEINTGDKVAQGKTVTFTATPNSGYKVKEWKVGNDIVTGNTSNTYTCTVTKAITVKVSFLAGETSYKVKHYKEKPEGGYPAEPTETEDKSGAAGTNAVYTPKTGGAYEGFTYKSELTKINGTVQPSGTIKPDGSTVVELFYERNTVNVTFNLAGGNVAGNTDPIVKTGKYGTAFTAPADPVKTDAVFKGWNPSLLSPLLYPASNAEYTAQWQAVPKYTVTFGVEGSNGTLKATVDSNEINTGDKVKQGKTVEFTAVPNAYYYVYQWTVNGGEFEAGTGIFGSTVAKVKITGNVTVSVSFNVETPLVEISSVIIPKAGTSYGGNKLPVKITGKNFKAYHVSQANFSGSGATFSNFNIVSDTFAMAEVECPSVVGDTTVTVTCKTASKTGVLSVKDYSTGYEVGKIVLADKSLVEKDSYTMVDHANPPVGVICGYTYGVPRMIALKKHYERLRWAEESTTGYSKKFEGIICNPSQTGDGAASTATFTGDIDGSDNWEYIKSIDPAGTADAATNYPAFNWVNEYNTTYASLLGGKSFAWYMPSLAELCEVYKNRIAINESYKKIRKLSYTYAPQELVFPYWSSSQYSNSSVYSDYDYAWFVFFKTGKLSSLLKNYYCSVCCLADFLNE
ncbi:InlB B-repeat-containing protein [Treponema denticola]|uniref:InlB B-repeat-containing protein n=1 Tax=Treponema denticola TaxID=158 RepID=UPI0021C28885|nr:InlB B-repeat-containing protein [Treponema denticola]